MLLAPPSCPSTIKNVMPSSIKCIYKPNGRSMFPPFALFSARKQVLCLGNHVYLVKQTGADRHGTRVVLSYPADSSEQHTMDCTCTFPSRNTLPCGHVLAVLRGKIL